MRLLLGLGLLQRDQLSLSQDQEIEARLALGRTIIPGSPA
jgi:hypothetical protein